MALNRIFDGDPKNNRSVAVPEGTASGDPVLVSGYGPGVALTGRGGETRTITEGSFSATVPAGGVGNPDGFASVAFDGTYEFAVEGVDTDTADGTPVYFASGALTLTAGDDAFGIIDYPVDYHKQAGVAPVKIGA